MIYTREQIGDPVDFLRGVATDLAHLQNGESELFSGSDKDVLISRAEDDSVVTSVGRRERHIGGAILGSLYIGGDASGVVSGGRQYEVAWYPSPTYVNGIVEELGLRPGEDVLRFVHAFEGTVPYKLYGAYFGRGEYPQSAKVEEFHHDRNFDHAPGVLLSPPAVTASYIKRGQVKRFRVEDARELDYSTSSMRRLSDSLFESGAIDQEEPYNSLDKYRRYDVRDIMPIQLHGKPVRKAEAVAKYICEYYLELRPKIAKLQNERPGLTAMALV